MELDSEKLACKYLRNKLCKRVWKALAVAKLLHYPRCYLFLSSTITPSPDAITYQKTIFNIWDDKIGIIDWSLQNILGNNINVFKQYAPMKLPSDDIGVFVSNIEMTLSQDDTLDKQKKWDQRSQFSL